MMTMSSDLLNSTSIDMLNPMIDGQGGSSMSMMMPE